MKFTRNIKLLILGIILLLISVFGYVVYIVLSSGNLVGTTGNIKLYKTNNSKLEVNRSIRELYVKFPNHNVPDELSLYKFPYWMGSIERSKKFELNADSANFFFYDRANDIIVFTGFSGLGDKWTEKGCILALVGTVDVKTGMWHFRKTMNDLEKRNVISFFEYEILPKIDSVKFIAADEFGN